MQTEHRSTARVLDILSLLASSKEGYNLNDISKKLDAPRTSLYPIVLTMAQRNFIMLNHETSKYTIGMNTYVSGIPFLEHSSIYETFLNEMRKIVNQCDEMCQLGVLSEQEVLYVGKIDSSATIRTVSHVGKRLPVYCTALGKALIHNYSREDLRVFFKEPLEAFTAETITDLEMLYQNLLTIRETHIAYDNQEMQTDIQCLALPIQKDHTMIAAISISIPYFRATPEKLEQCRRCLLDAQTNLEFFLSKTPIDQLLGFYNGIGTTT